MTIKNEEIAHLINLEDKLEEAMCMLNSVYCEVGGYFSKEYSEELFNEKKLYKQVLRAQKAVQTKIAYAQAVEEIENMP